MKEVTFEITRVGRRWRKIEQLMHEKAETLAHQGSIASRMSGERRVWMLRFTEMVHDRAVQRAVYIGGDDQPEILERARRLLDDLRAPQRFSQELSTFLAFTRRTVGLLRRRSPRSIR